MNSSSSTRFPSLSGQVSMMPNSDASCDSHFESRVLEPPPAPRNLTSPKQPRHPDTRPIVRLPKLIQPIDPRELAKKTPLEMAAYINNLWVRLNYAEAQVIRLAQNHGYAFAYDDTVIDKDTQKRG
jgi:hypothetical protein